MKNLRSDIMELFGELQLNDSDLAEAAHWQLRKAAYHAAYDAERAKDIRCNPVKRARRKATQSAFEKRKWARTKSSETELSLHNAKRREAHARLLRDPKRLAVAKAKQAAHSKRHADRRRALRATERAFSREGVE